MWNYMRTGVLISGMLLMGVSGASAQVWGRQPVPAVGACFYEGINFEGRYFCARPGSATAQVPNGTNDTVSSIQIFGNAEVMVYGDANFRGASRLINGSVRDLERFGWNDLISSFRVVGSGAYDPTDSPVTWRRDRAPSVGACFYENVNFAGRYFCTSADSLAGADTPVIGLEVNDRISSIRVFGNASVTAFRDGRLEGPSVRIDSDVSDLGTGGGNNWDDAISSFRVTPRGGGFGGGFGRGPNGGFGNGPNGGFGNNSGFTSGLEVFADIGFKGTSATLPSNTPDVGARGMGGLISSLRVPAGQTWQVCTEANFEGRCQLLTDDVSDLRRGNWNDVILSARRVR